MNFYERSADRGVYYGNLPHWRQDTVCYFVTFRTADSIPQMKLKQWIQERDEWLLDHPKPWSETELSEYNKLFSRKIEQWLDLSYGECVLAGAKCKEIVAGALCYFNNQRYTLWEYTVAANHVHLLIEPLFNFQLDEIMRSLKSFTAKEINKVLGRSGHFWQKEYFDHIVRSEEHYLKFVDYIRKHNIKNGEEASS